MFILALSLISGGKVHAASITVNTDSHPSVCTLDEAIVNINDHARTNTDCVETGSYGVNDTITIPEGTVTLTADLPQIHESVTITGAGVTHSVINGGGQYQAIISNNNPSVNIVISDLKITAFYNIAINTQSTNIEVRRVDIDGSGSNSNGGALGGILSSSTSGQTVNQTLENVYVHDLTDASATVIGIGVMSDGNGTIGLTSRNITIARLHNTQGGAEGYFLASGIFTDLSPGTLTADIQNLTIDSVTSDGDSAIGIAVIAGVSGGDTSITSTVTNATVHDISGRSNQAAIPGAAIGTGAGGAQTSDNAAVQLTLKNVIADTITDANNAACATFNFSTNLGGDGSSNAAANIISQGGNFSASNSCSPYFNQPTDQNNITNLSSTLGALGFNGGYVPTMALLQGSPAIDSGVSVAGLTTDARGVARPQGLAYDSGAYESPYTKPSLASTGENITSFVLLGSILAILSSLVLYYKFQLTQYLNPF